LARAKGASFAVPQALILSLGIQFVAKSMIDSNRPWNKLPLIGADGKL
jgi:hypothetical protein